MHWSDNRHRKKNSNLQINPNWSPEKVKLKSRELKSELNDPNRVAQMAQNGNMKVRKRANVGENWAVKADGESDQSIAQNFNLKCQNDCINWCQLNGQLAIKTVIETELTLSCNCNTVLTEVVKDQEAKGMNLSRMCEWIKEINAIVEWKLWISHFKRRWCKFTELRQPRR